MTIVVELFARSRELAGCSQTELHLPDRSQVRQLRSAIVERHPPLASLLAKSAIAVNDSYVRDDHELHAGDHVAVLPPVSGG